tara:strand:- start:2863 stop:4530 length:1668 start_codon:yes stop_codon:yes gene_type:complete
MKEVLNKNKISIIIFLSSTLVSFILGELYFYSTRGMDYGKYQTYLRYFQGITESTGQGQGILYYYLIAFISDIRLSLLNNVNLSSFLSSNIQILNMLLYLFGLRGFYIVLKNYRFSTSVILYSFSFLNFFPPTFEMRLLMKPEIAAFAFLPWLVLSVDKLFQKFDYKYLALASITASIIFSLKGSILGMVSLFLFIKYIKKIYLNRGRLIIFITVFVIIFSSIYIENFNVNQIHLLDHDSEEYEAWQNKASINFLYHLNKWDFYYFPIRHYHNNSLIGITLFDTFGDYFDLSFNSDSSYFNYERQKLFSEGFLKTYSRQYLALFVALVFYLLLFIFFIKEKKYRIYLFSPLIGIVILLVNAFGFPNLNFDPLTGDTFKVHYYSFFLTISFIFLSVLLLKTNKILGFVILIFFSLSSIYVVGFPKTNENNIGYYLSSRNSVSPFCSITNLIFDEKNRSNCNKPENMCLYNPLAESVNAQTIEKKDEVNYNLNPIDIKNNDGSTYTTKSSQECINLIKEGSEFDNKLYENLRRPPFINLLYFLIAFFINPYFLKREL